jgi:hypothetical protein
LAKKFEEAKQVAPYLVTEKRLQDQEEKAIL